MDIPVPLTIMFDNKAITITEAQVKENAQRDGYRPICNNWHFHVTLVAQEPLREGQFALGLETWLQERFSTEDLCVSGMHIFTLFGRNEIRFGMYPRSDEEKALREGQSVKVFEVSQFGPKLDGKEPKELTDISVREFAIARMQRPPIGTEWYTESADGKLRRWQVNWDSSG